MVEADSSITATMLTWNKSTATFNNILQYIIRRRAFALGEQVSDKWSRCTGSIGRLSASVGRRHPVTIRKALFMAR